MIALDRLNSPRFTPKSFGLSCPHCGLRSMMPVGGRVYVCVNPECTTTAPALGAFVSMLTIDPLVGAHLRPWEEVAARDRARRTDPRGFLRTLGAIA